ncbi:MAG: hypothetical protein E7316_03900 [Clostridiales bacterium]|nr:hypothetical protein [Clostridiales bacterium]
MERCCICGHDADLNLGGLLINGRTVPICADCAGILDKAEELDQNAPERKELHAQLQAKMKNSNAGHVVIATVNRIFTNEDSQDIQMLNEREQIEHQQETEAVSPGSSIESLCSFLSVFAVILLIAGIVLSLLIGVPLTQLQMTRANGWGVIIGGIIGTMLTFAMIMLVLSVASAIGRINAKLDDTNDQLAATNKHLARIASMLSAENRKQKKS